MTQTLQTKQGSEWTNDLGQTFPAAPLYRFTDENGDGPGCWYGTIERAETSWQRWIAAAPVRARRQAENARYAAAVAANASRDDDPFAAWTS